jgi:endonuclease YncB( thermonuclease family)
MKILAFLAMMTVAANAAELVGTVTQVRDGDTFDLCNETVCTRIRLCGINAPERGTTGSAEATAALRSLLGDRPVRCVQVGSGTVCDGRSKPTNRGRVVAQCHAGGEDVAAALVSRGLACDWVGFSGGHYSRRGAGRPCQ